MMEYVRHGGYCCGYAHIYGFDEATIADFDAAIETHFSGRHGGGRNRILEAILTDRQLIPTDADRRVTQEVRDAGGWPVLLASRGFRLAAQWQNSNTGRHCYQFLKIETLLTDREGYVPRFDWEGAVLAAAQAHPVAPPPPAVPRELPVRVPEGTTIPQPPAAPIDPNLPIQVRDGRDGRVYNGRVVSGIAEGGFRVLVDSREATASIRGTWHYNLETGWWSGDDGRGQAFNVREPREVAVAVEENEAPAAARRVEVVATELYANLQNGGRRGPFLNIAEVRAAYPRARRIERRSIMSNGTSEWTSYRV